MTAEANAPAGANPKFGRYEILDEIGKGGMGIVYRARDPSIGRTVAVKTVRLSEQGSADEVLALRVRLLRESQAAGQLSHPNIVPIFDFGEQGDIAYIVMEYISGPTLEQALEQNPSIRSTPVALGILADCARALDYAHGRGIVHRDVKPGNIMLQLDGTVKIADFGIAKVMQGATLTATSIMVGSPYYMAPEQLKAEAVSGRTDQYALATLAYAMFTGRRPFEADSIVTLITRTLYDEPPPVPDLNPAFGLPVDGVLRKALAKDPAARFGSCTEFVEALRTACETPPAASLPPQPPQPKRPRTSWVPWAIGAVVLMALLALAAVGAYFYQANQAEKVEVAYWESVKDSKNRALFASYIQRYPQGRFAGLAQAEMAALRTAPPAPPPAPVKASQPAPGSTSSSTVAKTEHAAAIPPVLPVPPSSKSTTQPSTERPPTPQPSAQPTGASKPDEACKPGLTEIAPERFQACMDTMSHRGFSPATLLAYDNGGVPFPMAAFQTPATRRATFAVPADQRREVRHRMENDGYRPDAVSVLTSDGHRHLFTEVWLPRAGPFEARVFDTKEDFDKARQKYEADGYVMTDLVPYQYRNETRYSAIWIKQEGAETVAQLDLTALDLSRHAQTLSQQGYRMSRISGYHTDSGRRFAAVWQKPQGGAFWEVNLTRENLLKTHAEMLGKGYRLHHISFVNGGFSAVWWN